MEVFTAHSFDELFNQLLEAGAGSKVLDGSATGIDAMSRHERVVVRADQDDKVRRITAVLVGRAGAITCTLVRASLNGGNTPTVELGFSTQHFLSGVSSDQLYEEAGATALFAPLAPEAAAAKLGDLAGYAQVALYNEQQAATPAVG